MTTLNPAGSARGLGASATPYTPPFSVQGSCVLSEDYFLTGQVIIGDNDLIRPFLRPDGTVEALVVQDGNLAYLHRDPGATSGWTYIRLSGPQHSHPGRDHRCGSRNGHLRERDGCFRHAEQRGSVPAVSALPAAAPATPRPHPLVLRSGRGLAAERQLSRFRAGTDPITGTRTSTHGTALASSGNHRPRPDTLVEVSGPALSRRQRRLAAVGFSAGTPTSAWAAGIVLANARARSPGTSRTALHGRHAGGDTARSGSLLWVGWPPSDWRACAGPRPVRVPGFDG